MPGMPRWVQVGAPAPTCAIGVVLLVLHDGDLHQVLVSNCTSGGHCMRWAG